MTSEKDRLGDTLHKKERAEEEHYFQEREKELLEKLRKDTQARTAVGGAMRCPKDGTALDQRQELGVTLEQCPTCNGIWLDRGELEVLAQRERDSWLGRLFFAPRR